MDLTFWSFSTGLSFGGIAQYNVMADDPTLAADSLMELIGANFGLILVMAGCCCVVVYSWRVKSERTAGECGWT